MASSIRIWIEEKKEYEEDVFWVATWVVLTYVVAVRTIQHYPLVACFLELYKG